MSALSAAKTLGGISEWSLTQLRMHKMLYTAQLLHLSRTDQPAFDDQFEAWIMGPVVRELRRATAHYRRDPIPDVIQAVPFAPGTTQYCAVVDAYKLTRHMGTGQLVNFTHRPGGAWEAYFREGVLGTTIPLEAIRAESKAVFQPSDAAMAWANEMADQIAASPSWYLEAADEQTFRERVCGAALQ